MPNYKEHPDVWIDPENSIVVQVKAAEFVQSQQFVLMSLIELLLINMFIRCVYSIDTHVGIRFGFRDWLKSGQIKLEITQYVLTCYM